MPSDLERWSEAWESHITGVLRQEDAIAAEIDQCLRDSDLLGAATASFEHVLTSTQLGDHREAYAYRMVGQMLLYAEMTLMQEELPEPAGFHIPGCIDRTPYIEPFVCAVGDFDEGEGEYIELDEEATESRRVEVVSMLIAVKETVDGAEAVLLLESDIDPEIKNTALRDAVAATVEVLIECDHPNNWSERTELLTLAKQLSRHFVINVDQPSSEIAFDGFERLALAAMFIEGKNFSTLNLASQAFDELQYGPAADTIGEKCHEYIEAIEKAKRFRLVYSTFLPILNTRKLMEPYAFPETKGGPWFKSRASRQIQLDAKRVHGQLKGDGAETDPEHPSTDL